MSAAEPNIEFVPAMTAFREFGISKVVGYNLIKKGELPQLLRDPATGRSYFLRHELKNAIRKKLEDEKSAKPSNNHMDVVNVAPPVKREDIAPEINLLCQKLTGKPLLTVDEIAGGRMDIPKGECGVYFLLKGRRVIYIGQSHMVFYRVRSHIASKDFDGFAFVPTAPSKLDIMESLYIHMLRPELNGYGHKSLGMVAPLDLKTLFSLK